MYSAFFAVQEYTGLNGPSGLTLPPKSQSDLKTLNVLHFGDIKILHYQKQPSPISSLLSTRHIDLGINILISRARYILWIDECWGSWNEIEKTIGALEKQVIAFLYATWFKAWDSQIDPQLNSRCNLTESTWAKHSPSKLQFSYLQNGAKTLSHSYED